MNEFQNKIYSNINIFKNAIDSGVKKIKDFNKPIKKLENSIVSNIDSVII